MLSILGLGAAYPSSVIDNRTLAGLLGLPESQAEDAAARTGVRSRATVLSEEFIKSGLPFNPLESYKAMTQSPTSLFLTAANQALAMAGAKAEDLGLIIGDTSTPYQTTPSEGQRLGKALGIARIPAYDVTGNSVAFPLHIANILRWKEERIPNKLIIGSANTPTQVSDLRAGADAWCFGDGAYAAVLSSREKGILKVLAADYVIDPLLTHAFSGDVFGVLKVELDTVSSFIKSKLVKAVEELKARGLVDSETFAAPPDFLGPDAVKFLEGLGFKSDRISYPAEKIGASFGASPGIALAEILPRLRSGDRAVVFAGGSGLSFGYLVVQAE